VGGSRPALAAVTVAVLVLLAGCGGQERPAPVPEAVHGFQSFRGYRPTPIPVRLEIPSRWIGALSIYLMEVGPAAAANSASSSEGRRFLRMRAEWTP